MNRGYVKQKPLPSKKPKGKGKGGKGGRKNTYGNLHDSQKGKKTGKCANGQQNGQQNGGKGGKGDGAPTPAQIDKAADDALKAKLNNMALPGLEVQTRLTQARADRAWNRYNKGEGSWGNYSNLLAAANAAANKFE